MPSQSALPKFAHDGHFKGFSCSGGNSFDPILNCWIRPLLRSDLIACYGLSLVKAAMAPVVVGCLISCCGKRHAAVSYTHLTLPTKA